MFFVKCKDEVYCLVIFQIDLKNQKGAKKEPLTLEKAVALVKDVFSAAAERDIYTGDGVKINVIRATGTEVIEVPLRRD